MKNMYKLARIVLITAIVAFMLVQLSGCKPKAVLLYDDSNNHFAALALDELAYSYTTVTTIEDFATALLSQKWDLIVADNPYYGDTSFGTGAILYDFVTKGGRLVISSWQTTINSSWPLWEELGSDVDGLEYLVPMTIFKLQPAHTIWNEPNALPHLWLEFGDDEEYTSHGFPGSEIGDGDILAVFDANAPTTTGALFIANSGRTIYNAFLLDDGIEGGLPMDRDGDGMGDSIEYWMNEISFVAAQSGKSVMPVLPAASFGVSEGAEANN